MKIELNYIQSLTDSELKREWKSRGYKEYHSKIGKGVRSWLGKYGSPHQLHQLF